MPFQGSGSVQQSSTWKILNISAPGWVSLRRAVTTRRSTAFSARRPVAAARSAPLPPWRIGQEYQLGVQTIRSVKLRC